MTRASGIRRPCTHRGRPAAAVMCFLTAGTEEKV